MTYKNRVVSIVALMLMIQSEFATAQEGTT